MESMLLGLLLIAALVGSIVWVIFLYTNDALQRGLSEGQVFLVRALSFITFPLGLFAWMLLRPSLRNR